MTLLDWPHYIMCWMVCGTAALFQYHRRRIKDSDHCNTVLSRLASSVLTKGYGATFQGVLQIDRPTLYLLPHASFQDFLVISSLHPKCRYITKPGVLKLPLAAFSAKKGNHIVVQVKDPVSRKKSKDKIASLLQQGYSVALFPEGKLRDIHTPPLPFHTGALEIAIAMKVPMVTVAIHHMPRKMWQTPREKPHVVFQPAIIYTDLESAVQDVKQRMMWLPPPAQSVSLVWQRTLWCLVIVLWVVGFCLKTGTVKQCFKGARQALVSVGVASIILS